MGHGIGYNPECLNLQVSNEFHVVKMSNNVVK